MEDIKEYIVEIIKSYAGKDAVVEGNISLINDLGFDSLQLVGVLTDIEKKFGISFEGGEKMLDLVDNLADMIEYVKEVSLC